MSNEAYPRSRTDTLVGPGMRIEGRVAFRGVLRVFGQVDGDVASPDDPGGTLVIEPGGRVAGAVATPNLVVKGCLLGAMRSTGSIEILPGGSAEGDTVYRALDVRAGGHLVGRLQLAPGSDAAVPLDASAPLAPVIPEASPEPPADSGLPVVATPAPVRPAISRRRLVLAAIVVAVLAMLWSRRTANDGASPPAPAVPDAGSTAPAPHAPAETAIPKPALPTPETEPPPPPATPKGPDADRVVAVQGNNPAKAASLVYVVTRDPVVVYRKRRSDAGEGTRIEIERNRNLGLPVARNEILRFAEGRAVEAFYQGRKLPPQLVESGAWMSFTPAAGE